MKIAHVVDSMEVGGAETLVTQMCRLQREQGHEPRVYAVGGLGPLGEQMISEGYRVESNEGLHLLDSARRFYRIFREWGPDVVHLHNPTPTVYAAIAARIAGVPSILSTRHSLVAAPHRLMVELKYAVAATCCDWVVGVCDATSKNLKGLHTLPAHKIVRDYNGAVPVRRLPAVDCPPKKGFTFLYVGRLAPVKNHALLLSAFRMALSQLQGLRLWMVGDGSERPKLESLATALHLDGQVTFWGQQLSVERFFSAADAFVMSSASEGLPISLLQALSAGLPAIVTDVGGMAEVVRLAHAGYIVPVTDPGQMAAAMVRVATSPAERERFSNSARIAFEEFFTLETVVRTYADWYRARGHKPGRAPA